jgi:hypothetical protein
MIHTINVNDKKEYNWKNIYPDFDFVVHKIKDLENEFKDRVDFKIFNNNQKIEVLKYLIMDKYGGAYIDRDLIANKLIDSNLIDKIGFLKEGSLYSNRVMTSKPNQDIWEQLIDEMVNRVKQGKETSSKMITEVINRLDQKVVSILNKYEWIIFFYKNWKWIITIIIIVIIILLFVLIELIFKYRRCCFERL